MEGRARLRVRRRVWRTFASRARLVHRVTGRTAGAHGGTVGSAIGTVLGNPVGTRARIH